jgi:hypothetical protein
MQYEFINLEEQPGGHTMKWSQKGGKMFKNSLLAVAGICLAFAGLTGCTKDLSTGRSFTEFQKPPQSKAVVYFVRDDNFMAGKPPYMFVSAAAVPPSVTAEPAKEQFVSVAIVGKDMFVPILVGPGDYFFRNAFSSDRVSVKSGDIVCIDVGSKFRGITVFVANRIDNIEECRKLLLAEKTEGVQLLEASKRLGVTSAQAISPEAAQAQIVLGQKTTKTAGPNQPPSAKD